MPVHKVNGGWRYGHPGHGHKVYKSKAGAMKQARAIALSKSRIVSPHKTYIVHSGVKKPRK